MKFVLSNIRWLWLAIALGAMALSGCASTDNENLSERPWNSPKTWENGMPSGINEGR